MAGGRNPTWLAEHNRFSGNGGPPRRGRSPSRGFIIGMGALFFLALFLAVVGAIAAQSSPGGAPAEEQMPLPAESPIPVEITVVPPEVTPAPEFAEALPQSEGPVVEAESEPEVHLTVTVAEPEPSSSAVQAPRTVASSWSAGPAPVPAEPAPAPATEAARVAEEANGAYGVRIVLEGQDWGANDEAQMANVQAVISAMDRLPDTVVSAVVAHAHGPLTFVSNDRGRTLGGWQPYGDHAMAYYTNSDQGPDGYHASNQVVLSVGATSMSIGHEVLHAYQFRNVGPDKYALALLGPEMRSFMEATGWRQTGGDDEVRQAADQPWSALDSLYVYEGRPLTYTTTGGATNTITPANPIEAFAVTGSIYYTRPSWMLLPDWPEYWAWFSANVG